MIDLNVNDFLQEVFFPVPSGVAGQDSGFRQFAWFLGAGCSVESSIPAASNLIQTWEERFPLRDGGGGGFENVENRFPGRQTFQKVIEDVCSVGIPMWGYYVLAQLMTHPNLRTRFNVALTTNFDDLLLAALYWYGYVDFDADPPRRLLPRHVSESTLSPFIMVNDGNPIIIPLHGTAQFHPLTDGDSQEKRLSTFDAVLSRILKGRSLIVVGYGGTDKGIQAMFSRLLMHDPTLLSDSIYWVAETRPDVEWLRVLAEQYQVPLKWVCSETFNALMYDFFAFMGSPSGILGDKGLNSSDDYLAVSRHIEEEVGVDSPTEGDPKKEWKKWASLRSKLEETLKTYADNKTNGQDPENNDGDNLVTPPISDDLTQTLSQDYAHWRKCAVDIINKKQNKKLVMKTIPQSRTRTVFNDQNTDQSVWVILCSKTYGRQDGATRYWFGLHGYQQKACKDAQNANVVLFCGEPQDRRILQIPFEFLSQYSFTVTQKPNDFGSYWHLRVNEDHNQWTLNGSDREGKILPVNVTSYVLANASMG